MRRVVPGRREPVAAGTTVQHRTRARTGVRPARTVRPELDQEEPMSAEAGTPVRPAGRPAGPARRAGSGRADDRTAAAAQPNRGGERWRTRLSWADIRLSPYLYIAPFFVLFGIFGLYPLVYTAWVSLHDWELASDEHPWSGLDNYGRLVDRPGVLELAVEHGRDLPALHGAAADPGAADREPAQPAAARPDLLPAVSVILPMATSVAAVSIVFSQLFSRDFGLVNWLLGGVGVRPIEWQASKWSSWSAVAAMVNWRWTGYNALIYLAAMQAIPRDLYEAAAHRRRVGVEAVHHGSPSRCCGRRSCSR